MKTLLSSAAAGFVAAAIFSTAAGTGLGAVQLPPDLPFPGSNMTRQQVMDKLSSAAPGTTVSVAKGREVYEKICAACHMFDDIGTAVGPDLTTLASRFRKRDVLDAILWPSKTISDQYEVTVFALEDGTYESGVIVREDRTNVYLKNSDYLERPLPIPLARIKERTISTASLMPENLVAPYTLDEIDSVVAFVLAGK